MAAPGKELRRIAARLCVLALLCPCPRAWADSGDTRKAEEPADPSEQSLLKRGAECFLRQDYEGARDALRQAYDRHHRPDTLLKLGIAELQSGHPVEAAQHLREFLALPDEPIAKLDAVRTKWLPRAEAQTAHLDIFAPAGVEIAVDGAAQDSPAVSTLDEVGAGRPRVSLVVAAGPHEVTVRRGSFSEMQHVVARGGELVELHFQRVPDAAPAEAPRAAAQAALQPQRPPAEAPPRQPHAKWITVLALGSAAVAAAGVAIGFSIAFEQNGSDASALRHQIGAGGCLPPVNAQCAKLWQLDDAEERNGALATGFYVGAGAAAGLALGTWLLWPHGTGPRLLPTVGRDSTGLVLLGAW